MQYIIVGTWERGGTFVPPSSCGFLQVNSAKWCQTRSPLFIVQIKQAIPYHLVIEVTGDVIILKTQEHDSIYVTLKLEYVDVSLQLHI